MFSCSLMFGGDVYRYGAVRPARVRQDHLRVSFGRGDRTMRKVWRFALGLVVGISVLAGNAGAQFKNGSQPTELNIPRVSQRGTVSQRIGLTDITITYHRPAVGGREIWGKTVPYGKVWRAGANENTTITFSDDVSVEGKPLAAGTYGLHAIPDKDQWTVIFSKNSTSWGSFSYDEKEDALRVSAKPHAAESFDVLTYVFEDVKEDSAAATLRWGKLAVSLSNFQGVRQSHCDSTVLLCPGPATIGKRQARVRDLSSGLQEGCESLDQPLGAGANLVEHGRFSDGGQGNDHGDQRGA